MIMSKTTSLFGTSNSIDAGKDGTTMNMEGRNSSRKDGDVGLPGNDPRMLSACLRKHEGFVVFIAIVQSILLTLLLIPFVLLLSLVEILVNYCLM